MDEMRTHYEAVLSDLQTRRDQIHREITELQQNLKELHNTIAGIRRCFDGEKNASTTDRMGTGPKYANISQRWAILDLLSESGPMTTSDIADTLKQEGATSNAQNFTNNVSAVLSSTMKGKGEVEQTADGKWQLTETGRNAISHIRQDGRFRKSCPWYVPSVATLGTPQGR